MKGTEPAIVGVASAFRRSGPSWKEAGFVLFALVYLLVRRAPRLAAGSASELHNDSEIMVLRQQLAVLKRQVGRPRLRRRDRLLMAAVSRVLPRPRWSSFVVRPQTLRRWHREPRPVSAI